MLNHFKHGCVLLLALPAVAIASPVTVTTHSTGLVDIEPVVMERLGVFNYQGTAPLPYELTLASTFEPGWSLGDRGVLWSTGPVDVTVDFRFGGFSYHYTAMDSLNTRLSTLDAATDRFEHDLYLSGTSGFFESLEFTHAFSVPSGSLGGETLMPGHVESSTAAGGSYATIHYSVPMAFGDPISATMNGMVSTYSVDITGSLPTSPVPEPGAYAMLGVGTLLLGLRRRVKHAPAATRS